MPTEGGVSSEPGTFPVSRVAHVKYRGAFGVSFFWHHAVVLIRDGGEADCGDAEAPELGAFDASRTTAVHWSAGGQARYSHVIQHRPAHGCARTCKGGSSVLHFACLLYTATAWARALRALLRFPQNGDSPLLSLDGAVIVEISWRSFVGSATTDNRHYDGITLVRYPQEIEAVRTRGPSAAQSVRRAWACGLARPLTPHLSLLTPPVQAASVDIVVERTRRFLGHRVRAKPKQSPYTALQLYSVSLAQALPHPPVVLTPPVRCCRRRIVPPHPSRSAQGVFVGVDSEGNDVEGYNPLSWNCEHFAVWCFTGTARSLQARGGRQLTAGCATTCLLAGASPFESDTY